jgi:hypothetical protein
VLLAFTIPAICECDLTPTIHANKLSNVAHKIAQVLNMQGCRSRVQQHYLRAGASRATSMWKHKCYLFMICARYPGQSAHNLVGRSVGKSREKRATSSSVASVCFGIPSMTWCQRNSFVVHWLLENSLRQIHFPFIISN